MIILVLTQVLLLRSPPFQEFDFFLPDCRPAIGVLKQRQGGLLPPALKRDATQRTRRCPQRLDRVPH